MTNYNDGQWHGWNGGECPVHPKTIVQCVSVYGGKVTDSSIRDEVRAELVSWVHLDECGVVAFRVVKEYREPREMWICIYDASAWDSKDQAEKHDEGRGPIIHVREVIE